MTDNTASPYTVPLLWVDVRFSNAVELRHEKYSAVCGVVEATVPDTAVRVAGAWHYQELGWSLWVKPEPAKSDPLLATIWAMYGMNHTTSMELTEVIRAAGYMTEAEWEAKRGASILTPYPTIGSGTHISLGGQQYMLMNTPERSKP